jgi:hypothetical protein
MPAASHPSPSATAHTDVPPEILAETRRPGALKVTQVKTQI